MANVTLQSLLEIEIASLKSDERRGLAFAEEIYKLRGSPTEPNALIAVLKEIVRECTKRNIRYGRALYGQLKRLERGEWTPRAIEAKFETNTAGAAAAPSEEELIARARANYSAEQFERWLKLHNQGKAMAAEPQKPGPQKSVISIEKGRKASG